MSRRRNPTLPASLHPALRAADGAPYFSDDALEEANTEGETYKSRTALVLMDPADFLRIADPGKEEARQVALEQVLREGTRLSDVPRLFVDYDKTSGVAVVTGHEGRHRSRSLLARGVKQMPVRIHSTNIRWSEQTSPKAWDYIEALPHTLTGEDGHAHNRMPMPVPIHYPQLAERMMKKNPAARAARTARAPRAPKTYLFSYGSNSPRQLAERLGHAVKGRAAFVEGHLRAFRGWSNRWEGGVATLIPGRGKTFGYIAEVTPDDLAILDRYEGVATGNYRRANMQVTTNDGEKVQAIAYLASSTEKNAPSRAYKRAVAETIGAFWEGSSGPVTEDDITVRNNSRGTNPAAKKDIVLYHGTLDQFVPNILREGLKPAPGWGGANTFGVFLSGSYDGAQNWGRYAAASNLDLDGDGESDFGGDAERYTRAFPSLPHVRVLKVTVPAAMAKNLRADMEQAEEHGFERGPKDWRASLSIIGDVMYAGGIPAEWLSPTSAPSASAALTPVQEARVREALYGLRYSEDAADVVRQAGARVREQLSARTSVSPNDVSALLSWYRAETKRNPAARASRTTRTNPDAPARSTKTLEAIAYLASSTEKNAPSRAYKRAVAETIGAFWEGENEPVTEADITVRNPAKWFGHLVTDDQKVTISKEPIAEVQNTEALQKAAPKPRGLWYACGSEWIEWLGHEMPHWLEEGQNLYDVRPRYSTVGVAEGYRGKRYVGGVLRITTDKEMEMFDLGFHVTDMQIDWPRVASIWDGIEICPYQYSFRDIYGWYYGWDVASGCIWRPSGADGLTLLHSRVARSTPPRKPRGFGSSRQRHTSMHGPRNNPRRMDGSVRPTRATQVNAYLAENGFPGVMLHRSARDAYCHFYGGDTDYWDDTSVYVPRISDLTLDGWLSEAQRLAETRRNPRRRNPEHAASDRFFDALEARAGEKQTMYAGPFVVIGDRKGGVLGNLEVSVGVSSTLEAREPVVRLSFIGVSPDQRGEGRGTALLNLVTAAADDAGLAVELDVDPQTMRGEKKPPMNKAALRAFYKKAGFATVRGMGSDFMRRPVTKRNPRPARPARPARPKKFSNEPLTDREKKDSGIATVYLMDWVCDGWGPLPPRIAEFEARRTPLTNAEKRELIDWYENNCHVNMF